MAVTKFRSRVAKKNVFNKKFCLVHLELVEPNKIKFEAGQYLLLTVPGEDQKKSYSICSEPQMDHAVELLVDLEPGGVGSEYLKGLKLGDEVEFMAPAGGFVVAGGGDEEALVFVATGSGISPIRSMILDLLEAKKDPRKIHLYWGLRYAEDMFWEEDFYQMGKSFENFAVDMILSQPPQGWKLSSGYVTDLVDGYEHGYEKSGFYLCGNKEMIEDVKQLLSKKQVEESRVHKEEFY